MIFTSIENKNITGKRLNLLISKEAYEALEKQKKNIKTTKYIENLIINASENPEIVAKRFTHQENMLEKLTQLINFNKKLYLDINATFSNMNQIAYRLNLANLNAELEMLTEDEHFLLDVKNVLCDAKDELTDLRELLKVLLKNLEKSKSKLTLATEKKSTPAQGETNASE